MIEEDDLKGRHWSGTFQRLRAEVTVCWILLLLSTHFDMVLERIPVIGVELRNPAPKETTIFFLYAFFVYFVLAWVARYLSERAELLVPVGRLERFSEKVDEQLIKLENLHPPDSSILLRQLQSWQDAYAQLKVDWNGAFKERVGTLQSLLTNVERVVVRSDRDSYRAQPQLAKQLEQVVTDLSQRKEISEPPPNFDKFVDDASEKLASMAQTLAAEIDEKGPAIASSATTFRTEMGAIRREMRKAAKAFFWDREIFGFFIPLFVAVTIFVVTLVYGGGESLVAFFCDLVPAEANNASAYLPPSG